MNCQLLLGGNEGCRIIRLKSKLIPIDEIVGIARELIKRDGFCEIIDLDNELQKVYIVNGRNKTVYFRFLINIFKNNFLKNSDITYMLKKKVKQKQFSNVLVKKQVLLE